MAKKIIKLTEADLQKIVQKVLSEQNITQTPDREALLKQLEGKIVSFIKEKQKNDFLTKIKVSVDFVDITIDDNSPQWVQSSGFNKKPIVNIIDGEGKNIYSKQLDYYPYAKDSKYGIQYWPKFFTYDTGGGEINTNSGLVIGEFINEIIGKDKTLKQFYENEPGIKEQVDSIPIRYVLYLQDPNGTKAAEIKVWVSFEGKWEKLIDTIKRTFAPKRLSKKVTQGNTTTMSKLFYGDSLYRNFDMGDYKSALEIAPMNMKLDKLSLRGAFVEIIGETPTTKIPPPIIAPQTIELKLIDKFNYDDIDIANPTEYQNVLNDFKLKLDNAVKNIKGFKDFLNGQTLTVYGYASQDAKPTAAEGGSFAGCSQYGKGPRKDYNMCLSQKRAEKVADDIQEIFTDLGLTTKIKGVGKGETYEFGGDGFATNGKDSEEDLSKNRRVTFELPSFTEEL